MTIEPFWNIQNTQIYFLFMKFSAEISFKIKAYKFPFVNCFVFFFDKKNKLIFLFLL